MQDISLFFDKFKKILTHNSLQREVVAEILGEVLFVDIDHRMIDIKNGAANIRGSSVLRSEIMLKKILILEKLKNNPSTVGIKEIR